MFLSMAGVLKPGRATIGKDQTFKYDLATKNLMEYNTTTRKIQIHDVRIASSTAGGKQHSACSWISSVATRRHSSSHGYASSKPHCTSTRMFNNKRHGSRINAARRRRSNFQSDTYVLMEPGKSEEFVSEEELKVRLKDCLENWPGNMLPPDLAQFESIDEAVSHLVRYVCELEVDGEVGSIQWYQVRLE